MSGGAGVEWLFGYAYPHDDISLEDFRSRDHLWELTKFAVDFFHQHLPFPEMEVSDELTASKDDYCLAKRGSVYAIYFPHAAASELELEAGQYQVRWYDPRHGGALRPGTIERVAGPGKVSLGAPPRDSDRDWVCLVTRIAE